MNVEFVFNISQKTLVLVENTVTQLSNCFVSGQHLMCWVFWLGKIFLILFCFWILNNGWVWKKDLPRKKPHTYFPHYHERKKSFSSVSSSLSFGGAKKKKEKKTIQHDLMTIVCCFIFWIHGLVLAQWVLCLISMHHSMMLLLFLQWCSLLIWSKWKRVDCWWMSFVWCFFCVHISDWVLWVLCLISMPHSMMLLLCLQSSYLLISWEKTDVLLLNTICVVSFVFTSQIEICKCCV